MNISELMNIEELNKAIADGLVSKRKHPIHPIYILNYTAVTQFAWTWNDVTLNCRGLVIDEDYNIVARSLPKFFSYEQLGSVLPEGDYVVEEKLDGSMLLAFSYNGEMITATRGSFESEQAIKAKEFLPSNFVLNGNATYIFEVIYKENRIVVDYDFEGLVLLDIVHTSNSESNKFINRGALEIACKEFGFRLPKIYSFNALDDILNHEEDNIEGFVLRYASGERVKIKTDDYKRLHRLITGVSEKTVWEALKDNKFDELIENVPDEFYNWVCDVKDAIEADFDHILFRALSDFTYIQQFATDRKAFALEAQKSTYSSILFNMLDNKDYSQGIWKMVRPEVTSVFKMTREDAN